MGQTQTVGERFWTKVDKTGECWLWLGSKTTTGYGVAWAWGRLMGAHRMAWSLTNGPIPEGLQVLHACDNPPCVNPAHLSLGSRFDNMRDMASKGRQVLQAHPERAARGPRNGRNRWPESTPRGEGHYKAKLTNEQVLEIRRKRGTGVRLRVLAAEYGVSMSLISRIALRQNWAHI